MDLKEVAAEVLEHCCSEDCWVIQRWDSPTCAGWNGGLLFVCLFVCFCASWFVCFFCLFFCVCFMCLLLSFFVWDVAH